MDDLQHGTRLSFKFWGWSSIPSWTETKESDYNLFRDQSRMDDILSWSLLSGRTYFLQFTHYLQWIPYNL